jgi:gallate decarboxylase subunit D
MTDEIIKGNGKTRIVLQADALGSDIVVRIFNEGAHIGAIALGEWDSRHQRTSVSVMTRLGHKDDAIAQKAAYLITRAIKKPACVIAGAHIDRITNKEIDLILENVLKAVDDFIKIRKAEA